MKELEFSEEGISFIHIYHARNFSWREGEVQFLWSSLKKGLDLVTDSNLQLGTFLKKIWTFTNQRDKIYHSTCGISCSKYMKYSKTIVKVNTELQQM